MMTNPNPSLREMHRNKPAAIINTQQQVSILDWLESTGRLIPRETNSFDYKDDVEELTELMVGDDPGYEDDDEPTADDDEEESV